LLIERTRPPPSDQARAGVNAQPPGILPEKENQVKYLKMLGLAAVAAAALMAFGGAGTASADELCTAEAVNKMCPEGKLITTLEASLVGSAKLESTTGETLDTCTYGIFEGTITNQGTGVDPITGDINTLDWGKTGTLCTFTTDTTVLGTLTATATSGGNGTVTGVGNSVTINTVLFGSCVYGTGTGIKLGTFTGGSSAKLDISAVVNKTSGGFACPSTAIWNATYQVTNHSSAFLIDN
jgi:hypothetical protein